MNIITVLGTLASLFSVLRAFSRLDQARKNMKVSDKKHKGSIITVVLALISFVLWSLYAWFSSNWFIGVPNVLGIVFTLIVVYTYYR